MDKYVIVIKEFSFNNKLFEVGSKLKIIGSHHNRGYNLESEDGYRIYEAAFLSNFYITQQENRDKKIKNLGL